MKCYCTQGRRTVRRHRQWSFLLPWKIFRHVTFLFGKWSKEGIPPECFNEQGEGAKRARGTRSHESLHASNSIMMRRGGARSSCRTRAILFFSGTLLGRTAPPRWGQKDPPLRPRNSTKFMYYARVTIISPHLPESYPFVINDDSPRRR